MYGSDFEKVTQLVDKLYEEMTGPGGTVDIEGVSPERIKEFIQSATFVSALLTQAVGNLFGSGGANVSIPRTEKPAADGVPAVVKAAR